MIVPSRLEETDRLADPEADNAFWPCIIDDDMKRCHRLFDEYDIEVVYDLGAGDLRFSEWAASEGYEVHAYEIKSEIVSLGREHRSVEDVNIHETRYDDSTLDSISGEHVAAVAFGISNEVTPLSEGLTLDGWWKDKIEIFYNGDIIEAWWDQEIEMIEEHCNTIYNSEQI